MTLPTPSGGPDTDADRNALKVVGKRFMPRALQSHPTAVQSRVSLSSALRTHEEDSADMGTLRQVSPAAGVTRGQEKRLPLCRWQSSPRNEEMFLPYL